MSYAMGVRETLAALECPSYSDSAWIGPFEQLSGAAYALLAAERHGFSRRDERRYQFHAHARENVAAWIAEKPFRPSDQSTFDDWVCGFYFNSALQRLLGAAEQLVGAFASQECPCGKFPGGPRAPRRPGLRQQREAALQLLEHLRNGHGKELPGMQEVVAQVSGQPGRMPFDPQHPLAVLHSELRLRQPRSGAKDDSRGGRPRAKISWSTAGPERQMETACAAFVLLCRAYNQLVGWHPAAREAACMALGAIA